MSQAVFGKLYVQKHVTATVEYVPFKYKSSNDVFLRPGKSDFVSGAAPVNVAGRDDRLEAWFWSLGLGKNCSH